jgi:hypothetical protein
MADTEELSAYLLNEPRSAQGFVITGDGQPKFECVAIADAIAHAQGCVECPRYQVQVRFDGNHNLHESIEAKHILIQFLEAFL